MRDLLKNHPGLSIVNLRIEAPDTGIVEIVLDETSGVAITAALSDAVEDLLGYPAMQIREAEPDP